MDNIVTMKRYELKFLLNQEQCDYVKKTLIGHMKMDNYGKTTIASVYYDTPDFRLIRTSLEKPRYKEKIRTRSYGIAKGNDKVFLEVKRKLEGVVYKRRVKTTEDEAEKFFKFESNLSDDSQIAREICYFRDYYRNLQPSIVIISDRCAYLQEDGDIRLTIDENPRYRTDNLNLHSSTDGTLLLPPGSSILEIKVQAAMPLWLTNLLTEGKIYKTSFSKVGEAYKKYLANLISEERKSSL